MKQIIWPRAIRLDLFDGQAAPAAASGESAAAAQAAVPDAGEHTGEAAASQTTREERRKEWQALIKGRYKDLYTEDTQRIIDRRFREAKETEAALRAQQPVIDMLLNRYDLAGGDMAGLKAALQDDPDWLEKPARNTGTASADRQEANGLRRELEALKQDQRRRESDRAVHQQLRTWNDQARELSRQVPGFDFQAQCRDPRFVDLLEAGVDVKTAYQTLHLDRILQNVRRTAEERVVQAVRAGGARPAENGTSFRSGMPTKDDVSGLSRKDRAAFIKRAARGESIRF